MKKTIALILALTLIVSASSLTAFAAQESDISGASAAAAAAQIYALAEGKITAGEIATVKKTAGEVTDAAATGLYIEGTDYSDAIFRFTGGDYTIGGAEELFEESFEANIGETITNKYNSVIKLKADTMTGARAGAAANITAGNIAITNAFIYAEGNQRYDVSCSAGSLVINDSAFVTLGDVPATAEKSEPMSNPALLVTGKTRTNMSVGKSKTYYFNSYCVTDGWAAMSTDSAQGDGLDFYSYNSVGIARTGGYGTYADTNCRVWLYGSRVQGAELGAIISNNGAVHCFSGADASDELLALNTGATTDKANELVGGRNAIQIHSPDMMGGGTKFNSQAVVEVVNSKLITTKDLVSSLDYEETYGKAVGKYVDFIDGAAILVKSHSADISLTNAEIQSHSNTILMTVMNSDGMSRYLKAGKSDTATKLAMTDMTVSGDVKNYDYQRGLDVSLNNTTWTGAVDTWSAAQWNEYWADCKGDEKCTWLLDQSKYSYNSDGTAVTVGAGSKWIVTGDSVMNKLTLEEGGAIEGVDAAAIHVFVDGKEVSLAAGTYEGAILITAEAAPAEFPEFKRYFSDVAADAWYETYVSGLSALGIINGFEDGSFRPDEYVTYGQALKMVSVAAGIGEIPGTEAHWAGGYLALAAAQGLLKADTDLDASCPRGVLAELCAGVLGLEAKGEASFTDTDSKAVAALAEAGVISGYPDGAFLPENPIKRSEIAKIVLGLIQIVRQ